MAAHPNRGRVWPIDQIRRWIAEKKTHEWIALQLGCADQRISKLCQKHGIKCCHRGAREAEMNQGWKGGRIVDCDGYVMVYAPSHPARRKHGPYVPEHRLVMERHIGRYLLPGEVVHHRNKVKSDNRIENLELFENNGAHLAAELRGQCPKWSEDGKRRILQGIANRTARLRRGGRASNQTTSQTAT